MKGHGMPEASGSPRSPSPLENLRRAIQSLATAKDKVAIRQVITDYPGLLQPSLDPFMTRQVREAWKQGDKGSTCIFLACRGFLARCRDQDIDVVLVQPLALPLPRNSPFGRLLLLENERTNLRQRSDLIRQSLGDVRRVSEPDLWATLQYELAGCLAHSESSDRVERLEEALEAYQAALEVWESPSYSGSPKWAQTLQDMATTLRRRIKGERADNLSRAIDLYQKALTVRTREKRPLEWAETQQNLGNAWLETPVGDRVENVQRGIECYKAALTVLERQEHPKLWAQTTHNLALAYSEHLGKDRVRNLEKAIKLCQKVQKVFSPASDPLDWARSQVALGNAFMMRMRGDRADNLERSIDHYNKALDVLSPEVYPGDWARACYNLAVAFGHRPVKDRVTNLRQAIVQHQDALRIYTPQAYPIEWAHVQTGLGYIYRQPELEPRAEMLEQAIDCYRAALTVRTRDIDPTGWASVQNSLGNAYADRIFEERAANQEKALTCYHNALQVQTREAAPSRWAETMNNLGTVYTERLLGDPARNQEKAIDCLSQALKVHRPLVFPNDCRRAARNLAHLLFTQERWAKAAKYYRMAIEATEQLYQAGATPVSRQIELREVRGLPAHAAYCLARLGEVDQAVEVLEQGKARALGEALARNEAVLENAMEDDRNDFVNARTRIAALEGRTRTQLDLELSAELRLAHENLAKVVARIQSYIPEFMPLELTFAQIASVASKSGQPLVYILTAPPGSLAIIVPPNTDKLDQDHVVWLDQFTDKDLAALLVERDGKDVIGGYLAGQLSGDLQALKLTLAAIGQQLMTPLAQRLHCLGISAFTLIPGGLLNLLPLHATQHNNGFFLDEFEVAYAPSARTLAHCHDRPAASPAVRFTLFAVGNPLPVVGHTRPLPFARTEVETIASFFDTGPCPPLLEHKATHQEVFAALAESAGGGYGYLHFACHGIFDPGDPLASGLVLAGGKRLSLTDLLDKLTLTHTRLAVLSACQTAITDFNRVPDEAIGLPSGFLTAGVPGVIGSLWPVSDLSTPLLMERFYLYHLRGDPERSDEGPLPPVSALRRAQTWLRDKVTASQVANRCQAQVKELRSRGDPVPIQVVVAAMRYADMARKAPDSHPFEHPLYWAAFTLSGAT